MHSKMAKFKRDYYCAPDRVLLAAFVVDRQPKKIKALKKLTANVFRFFKGVITVFIIIDNSSIDFYQLVNRMHLLLSNHDYCVL